MDIIITSKNQEKFWSNKYTLTIGSFERCDFVLNLSYEILISIKYDFYTKNYVLVNTYKNSNIMFCRQSFNRLELGKINKLYFKNSDEFLIIKILEKQKMPVFSPANYTYKKIFA